MQIYELRHKSEGKVNKEYKISNQEINFTDYYQDETAMAKAKLTVKANLNIKTETVDFH